MTKEQDTPKKKYLRKAYELTIGDWKRGVKLEEIAVTLNASGLTTFRNRPYTNATVSDMFLTFGNRRNQLKASTIQEVGVTAQAAFDLDRDMKIRLIANSNRIPADVKLDVLASLA